MPWHNATAQHMNDDKRQQKNRRASTHTLTPPTNSNNEVKLLHIFSLFFVLLLSFFFIRILSSPFLRLTMDQIYRERGKSPNFDGPNCVYAKCEQMTSSLLNTNTGKDTKKYARSIFNLMRTCFFVPNSVRFLRWIVGSVWNCCFSQKQFQFEWKLMPHKIEHTHTRIRIRKQTNRI